MGWEGEGAGARTHLRLPSVPVHPGELGTCPLRSRSGVLPQHSRGAGLAVCWLPYLDPSRESLSVLSKALCQELAAWIPGPAFHRPPADPGFGIREGARPCLQHDRLWGPCL